MRAPTGQGNPSGRPAAAGEEEFTTFYRCHVRVVTRFVASIMRPGDGADVDDVVQVVFLRAWPNMAILTGRPDGVAAAWLITVARRVVAEQYRKAPGERRRREYVCDPHARLWLSTLLAQVDHADEVADRVDTAASMRAASEAAQRAVWLRVVEGYSWAQLGTAVGRGKAAARAMVAAATGGAVGPVVRPRVGGGS